MVLRGAFLMLMLIWAAFKNVLVARKQHLSAAWTHGEDRPFVEMWCRRFLDLPLESPKAAA